MNDVNAYLSNLEKNGHDYIKINYSNLLSLDYDTININGQFTHFGKNIVDHICNYLPHSTYLEKYSNGKEFHNTLFIFRIVAHFYKFGMLIENKNVFKLLAGDFKLQVHFYEGDKKVIADLEYYDSIKSAYYQYILPYFKKFLISHFGIEISCIEDFTSDHEALIEMFQI